MTEVLSSKTLVPIGLVATLAVAIFYAAPGWFQISANADDIDTLEEQVDDLKNIQTRSIMTNENINVLLERQQRIFEGQDAQLDAQQRQIYRLEVLIERLGQPGGTAN